MLAVRNVLVVLCLCFLTACGDLPAPFSHGERISSNPLLNVGAGMGIAVLPLSGVGPPLDELVSGDVARRLQQADIPAEALPVNPGLGYVLLGRLDNIVENSGVMRLDLFWDLRRRNGVRVNTFEHPVYIDKELWMKADGGAAKLVGSEVAIALIDFMVGDEPPPPPVAQKPQPAFGGLNVHVRPVEGAPGDGEAALQLAMIETLTAANVRVGGPVPDVILQGQVASEPFDELQDHVRISWVATSASGRDLGTVSLDNVIPRGALDGRWRGIAFAIAEAGLPGVMDVLGKAKRIK